MITEAFDAWSRGDQNAAIERVRPAADAGDAIGLGLNLVVHPPVGRAAVARGHSVRRGGIGERYAVGRGLLLRQYGQ